MVRPAGAVVTIWPNEHGRKGGMHGISYMGPFDLPDQVTDLI
jgi:hypothetical protein